MCAAQTTPIFLNEEVKDGDKFMPLPRPAGAWPYRLDLCGFVTKPDRDTEKVLFHMVGDTGGLQNTAHRHLIANAMAAQLNDTEGSPAFLLHLGDVVYDHGEAGEYASQFFVPYEPYNAPIFALAGNHDADVNVTGGQAYQSLDAFMDVFCDNTARQVAFSGNSKRLSMVQPNVYWTLQSPLANFIVLYSNVSKYGLITNEQEEWFIHELRQADGDRPHKALIVCLHHAPYSADTNHGSSSSMIAFLERAFRLAGVKPDMVCSGHVHNYQRFTKIYEDGVVVPYVVAGAGGYADLHLIATQSSHVAGEPSSVFDHVWLENYCDDCHGFLKMAVESRPEGLLIVGEYHTVKEDATDDLNTGTTLFERFCVPLYHRNYVL